MRAELEEQIACDVVLPSLTDSGTNPVSWGYGYDSLDRLTSATGPATYGWSYDANVTEYAAITGPDPMEIPQTSHGATPAVDSNYIQTEIPRVLSVRMVMMACGMNDTLVSTAAA